MRTRITPDIVRHELIGKSARIVRAADRDTTEISGRIIDETRNTVSILHGQTKKIVVKNVSIFQVHLCDGSVVEIDGKLLVGRPHDRLKRKVRRRW